MMSESLRVVCLLLAVVGLQSACLRFQSQNSATPSPHGDMNGGRLFRRTQASYTPGICALTSGAAPTVSKLSTCEAYNSIYNDFLAAIPTDESELSNFYGAALRLAFHDAGEVDVRTVDRMGPDGCLSATADNAGLVEDTSNVLATFEPIWQRYCDKISRADFWALLGKLVVENAADGGSINIPFQYGRVDNADCSAGEHRLPSAQGGMDEIERIFVTQMGLTIEDGVTLLGGHVFGHVHANNSGYHLTNTSVTQGSPIMINAWSKTPTVFNTEYYGTMFNTNWFNVKPNGNATDLWKNLFLNIMLNVDMSILFNIDLSDENIGTLDQKCGPAVGDPARFGCINPSSMAGASTFSQVVGYIGNEQGFFDDFAVSYVKMVTVGYGVPDVADGSTSSGKLGTLTSIDLSSCSAIIEGYGDVDYSCLHANKWITDSDMSTVFGSSTGITTSAYGEYVPPIIAKPTPGPKPSPSRRESHLRSRQLQTDDALAETPAWNIEFTGIPQYNHIVTAADVTLLNGRPQAATDFDSGATTVSAGAIIEFGADIGYNSPMCSLGYWPKGPACPSHVTRTGSFNLQPAPEITSSGCFTEAGRIGTLLNGAGLFGWSDATSHNDESVWHPSAMAFEAYDLDICLGHATLEGEYHHHSYTPCFAEEIGDTGDSHSPIWGFILDGYPIYGPYDDADELAASCWEMRDYSSGSPSGCGSDNIRSCLMVDPYDMHSGTVAAAASGPSTTETVTSLSNNLLDTVSGVYFEDYFFNSTCTAQGGKYLDSHNGHSHGTYGYHYHFTLSQEAMDADGTVLPTFPYMSGPKYYGCRLDGSCCTGPSGGACNDRLATSTISPSICGASLASTSSACSGLAGTPTEEPSKVPSFDPTMVPTFRPTAVPSVEPTGPSIEPTVVPSPEPTIVPSVGPTLVPSLEPTAGPTIVPSFEPTAVPSTVAPSYDPTLEPSSEPTLGPTLEPTEPSFEPTVLPSLQPTLVPSSEPTAEPSFEPSEPSFQPTSVPSLATSGAANSLTYLSFSGIFLLNFVRLLITELVIMHD